MKFLRKNAFFILAIILLIGTSWTKKEEIIRFIKSKIEGPCESLVTYATGAIDPKFGVSKAELIKYLASAEQTWEKSSGRDLFRYDINGSVNVNLIYDYRQSATDKLHNIGIVIKDDKETYLSLKEKYDNLSESYERRKLELQNSITNLEKTKSAFEQEVEYWNERGGAPPDEYQKLEAKRSELNAKMNSLNKDTESLNDAADTINSLATVINQIIDRLNLSVAKYNDTSSSTGEEFNEGEYIRNTSGERIDIYQFDNKDKLVRVLAHELGHALGLEHVDDPKAIMYKQNQSTNQVPTNDDIAELRKVCALK